ncbi:MAG: hypothetical protein ACE5GX_02235 [Thermoanaerobaculia bacterium]
MKLTEYLEDLDPNVAGKLEQAVQAVREEFEERLTTTVQSLVEEATTQAGEDRPAGAEAPTQPALALDAADELRMAALDIDVATSQADILEALSRSALRFASRVVIFVNRGSHAHGWSSAGFGDADAMIREITVDSADLLPDGASPEAGSHALTADDCGAICDALGADRPSMGLLMPFVLGNQVVGTVYCDRLGDDPFSLSSLQLLTYIAGQTLETLPVRKRSSTATLALTGGASAAVAEPETETEPEADLGVEAEPEVAPPPTEADAEPAIDESAVAEPEPAPEAPAAYEETEVEEGTEASESEVSGTIELPEPSMDAAPDLAPIPSEPEDEPEEASRSGLAADDAPAAAEAPATEIAPPADPAEPTLDLGSTEVSPPGDLEGPGWAFTSSAPAGDAGSDSEHEEAQRLARLLVTEIKLYNEEAVEEGRRSSSVYSRLQEDIDRSRQIFEDRIDERVRAENDYFKQALVRILAGGDPSLLGI